MDSNGHAENTGRCNAGKILALACEDEVLPPVQHDADDDDDDFDCAPAA